MKNFKFKLIVTLTLASIVTLSLSYKLYSIFRRKSKELSVPRKDKKLKVVVTTGMLEDAIKNIAKDKVSITSLMGPGVDPHSYKAAPGDLRLLKGADVIIYNGLHLEGKMSSVLEELNKLKPTYAAGDAIEKDLIITDEEFAEGADPHIWFDVLLWKKVVIYLCKILKKHDPKNAEEYQANTKKFITQLDDLDNFIKTAFRDIPKSQRVLITAHDAFGYFGRAYGLEVKGLQGISTAADYGLGDIINLIKIIIAKKIKAIFLETSVPEKPIRAVIEGCELRGHKVVLGGPLYSDAMGARGTLEGTYIGMVKTNVRTIAKGLKSGTK